MQGFCNLLGVLHDGLTTQFTPKSTVSTPMNFGFPAETVNGTNDSKYSATVKQVPGLEFDCTQHR